ncbi:MAG: S1C family serine protease [Verrucomicrobiae bacterium]|nr:S1C family serine protease [Verrucomicrobiae bacterium]
MRTPSLSSLTLRLLLAPGIATGFSFLSLTAAEPAKSVFDQVGQEVSSLYDRYKESVVKVKSLTVTAETGLNGQSYEASGFFVDTQGTLLTTASVIRDSDSVWVEIDGKRYDAKIQGFDSRSGLAVLKIPYQSKPLPMASQEKLNIGSAVVSIGFPYNLPSSPTFGFVAGFDTQYKDSFFITTHIRANLAISPGQAGSPVMTPDGKVIGMLVAGMDDGKISYALPSSAIKKIREDMQAHNGQARHAWVGVGVTASSPGVADNRTVRVHQIYAGTPAEKSDIRPGDVILKIGRFEIFKPSDVIDASFYARVGEPINITVMRDGRVVESSLTLATRPVTNPVVEKVPSMMAPGPSAPDRFQLGNKAP